MVAICPTCHDEIHHGRLRISDEVLYSWKGIDRKLGEHRDHIYVEPGTECKLLTGSITLQTTNPELIVFQLPNANSLSFRVFDEDVLLLKSLLRDLDGNVVLKIADNYVKVQKDPQIEFHKRTGKVRISVTRDAEIYLTVDGEPDAETRSKLCLQWSSTGARSRGIETRLCESSRIVGFPAGCDHYFRTTVFIFAAAFAGTYQRGGTRGKLSFDIRGTI
jgi:hypothetical protein